MDFSVVDLDPETLAFWRTARAFFEEHVTEEVLLEEERTGAGFNEGFHLALGERGWVVPDWPVEEGGAGLDPIRKHLLASEYRRSGAPAILASTTMLPLSTIRQLAPPEVSKPVLAGVASGHVRICLGYTEPDTGSDLAAVKTKARLDGDEWVIDGQKMFTTAAQHCQYCFLLARTDPNVPKHHGLTVFLVPLDLPGIEITPVLTLGGERTNFVYYDGVRLPDRYRLGAVNDGWKVVHGALDAEHGLTGTKIELGDTSGVHYERYTATMLETLEAWLADRTPDQGLPSLHDPLTRERLALAALEVELSGATPKPMCRISSSVSMKRATADLLELVGPAGILPRAAPGSVAGGEVESAYRFAPGTAIYGGTVEVFRNMVAERFLGLPRSTPRPT